MSLFGFRSKAQPQMPVTPIAASLTDDTKTELPIPPVKTPTTKQTTVAATTVTKLPDSVKDETLQFALDYITNTSLAEGAPLSEKDESESKYPSSRFSFMKTVHTLDAKIFEQSAIHVADMSPFELVVAQSLRTEFKKSQALDGVLLQASAINSVKSHLRGSYCHKMNPAIRILPSNIRWKDADKTSPQTSIIAISYPPSLLDAVDHLSYPKEGKLYDYLSVLISTHSRGTGRALNTTPAKDATPTAAISLIHIDSLRHHVPVHSTYNHHRRLQSLEEMAHTILENGKIPIGPVKEDGQTSKIVYAAEDKLLTFQSVNLKRHNMMLMRMDWERLVCEILIKHYEQICQSFSDTKDREEKLKTVKIVFPESNLSKEEKLFQSYFIPLFHIASKTPEPQSDPNVLDVKTLIEFTRDFISLFNFRKNVVPLYYADGTCPFVFQTYPSGQTQGMPLMGELTIQGHTPDYEWFKPPVNK